MKVIGAFLLVALFAVTASAAVLVVDSTGQTPGSYATLQEAVDAARDGDHIRVVTEVIDQYVGSSSSFHNGGVVHIEFTRYVSNLGITLDAEQTIIHDSQLDGSTVTFGGITFLRCKVHNLHISRFRREVRIVESSFDEIELRDWGNLKVEDSVITGLNMSNLRTGEFSANRSVIIGNILEHYYLPLNFTDCVFLGYSFNYDKELSHIYGSFMKNCLLIRKSLYSINSYLSLEKSHVHFSQVGQPNEFGELLCNTFERNFSLSPATPFFTDTLEVRPNPFSADECSPHPPDATDFYGYPRTNPYQIGPFNVDANIAVTTQIGGYYKTEHGYVFTGLFAPYSGPLALLRIGGQAIALNNLGLGNDKSQLDSVYTSEPFWLHEGSHLGAIDNSQVSWPYLRVE